MEELSYNIGTSACCRAACVACWKCSALRHSTTQPHHRQNKKMGRIREEAMGGGNREHQKPRRWTNAASAPPSFHLLPSHIYLSIYTVYSFAYKHFYFIFFFTFWRRRKKEKNPSGNRDIRSLYVPPRLYTVSNSRRRRVLSFFSHFRCFLDE